MINKKIKSIIKKIYHMLTSGNADIAFYTENFVTNNAEWIMKNPILFGINLIKININCRIPHKKYTMKELVPGNKCLSRAMRRPKVYKYYNGLLRYTCIFTDIFGSLLEFTLDMDELYRKIENKHKLPGFYKLRKKKENCYKTITSIYEDISRELNVIVSKDIEIDMIKNHLILNPYLKRIFEIALYNQINVIGIIETSYSVDDIKEILGGYSINLTDIRVSNEKGYSFKSLRNEVIQNYKNINSMPTEEEFVVISSNYNKAIKNSRKYHVAPKYYRSSKEIMQSIPIPNLTNEFKQVYQTITGMELFSGQYNHKNIYETVYLYLAPAIYVLLEQTYQKSVESGAKVIALCDPECIFIKLYEKYFGEINPCIWSGFAGAIPNTKEEWNEIINDCYFIESFPADRIAHSLGFTFKKELLKNCRDEFIEEGFLNARHKEKEVIKSYLKNYLKDVKKVVVIDPIPGLSSLNYFCEYVNGMNPNIEMEGISMSGYLEKESKELYSLHRILQADIPYVMGLYGNEVNGKQDENLQLSEITFAQPKLIEETKLKIIYGAMDVYCKAFIAYQRKNKDFKILPSDVSKLLDYSKEAQYELNKMLGGIE